MRSNYKRLGDFIEPCDEKNDGNIIKTLQGISNQKFFQKAKTNIIGIDLSKYRIVRTGQFAFNRATTRNGDKISIALREGKDCIVSPSYRIFRSKDENILNSEYLMMWFRRPEFDRYARFKSHGSAHEFFDLNEMYEVELPIPAIEKQREIVKEYNTVVNRVKLNEQLNQKLEETAQALYKHWFVDEVDSDEKVKLDKYIEFNPKHSIAKGEVVSYVEMADVQEDLMSLRNIVKREFTAGTKFKNDDTLLARITPCLENGKTAYVTGLKKDEVGYGSTEFIVMRAKSGISSYWVYCLARDDEFRSHAISSMIGSSGRQRVHSDYLKEYEYGKFASEKIKWFDSKVKPLFEMIKSRSMENQNLIILKDLILSKMTKVEVEKMEVVG